MVSPFPECTQDEKIEPKGMLCQLDLLNETKSARPDHRSPAPLKFLARYD